MTNRPYLLFAHKEGQSRLYGDGKTGQDAETKNLQDSMIDNNEPGMQMLPKWMGSRQKRDARTSHTSSLSPG